MIRASKVMDSQSLSSTSITHFIHLLHARAYLSIPFVHSFPPTFQYTQIAVSNKMYRYNTLRGQIKDKDREGERGRDQSKFQLASTEGEETGEEKRSKR